MMRIAVVALTVVITIVVTRSIAIAQLSAEELYAQGQAAYDDGDYRTAIDLWTSSYKLSRQPLLLFNVAQALRLAGRCERALSTYKQFVALDPAAEQRPLADELVRELEPRCGQPARLDEVPRPVEVESTGSGRRLRIAGLVTGGAGVALVTAGLLFGRRASTLGDEVSDACSRGCDWAAHRGKDAAGRRAAVIGYSLDALGIAAIAAGAVTYYLGARESAVTVAPRPREGGATVTWSGRW